MLAKDMKMETGFTSLNPNESLMSITADSPEELAASISKISVPIKIIGFTSYGTKQVCYFNAHGFKIKKKRQETIE